jgi:hypothetical protein
MPRKRSAEEEGRTEAISAARGDLSVYRQVLLDFCDRVGCDIVDVDQSRAICKIAIVSSRRITRILINSVIEAAMQAIAQMKGKRDAMLVLCAFKRQLLAQVDKVSFVANLLPAFSTEARRKRRGEELVLRGGPELVDATTKEVCELYWQQVQERDALEEEAKAAKRQKPAVRPAEVGKATTTVRPASPSVGRAAPVKVKVATAAADESNLKPPATLDLTAVTKKARNSKPKSSINKTQAGNLMQLVADFVAGNWTPGKGLADMELMPAIDQLVDDFWPTI